MFYEREDLDWADMNDADDKLRQESDFEDEEFSNEEWDEDWEDDYEDPWDEDLDEDDFADPGGNSALRAATPDNPRIFPCPNCGKPNRLTQKDVDLHYQCDECADQAERGNW